MSYLLDTNILSELVAVKPNASVVEWLSAIPNEAQYISVITIGEIRRGVERIEAGKRKQKLKLWLEHELCDWFEDRILPIDIATAEKWGYLLAQAKHVVPAIDGLLAATAVHHDLTLITRNAKDFKSFPLEIINPWEK